MPVQINKKPKSVSSGQSIKPWQLAVFALAILLIGWQVISYLAPQGGPRVTPSSGGIGPSPSRK
jgi:hypothetical protein